MAGWSSPDAAVKVAGIKGEVALCRTTDGKVVAALDADGNLGITGSLFTGEVSLEDEERGGAA